MTSVFSVYHDGVIAVSLIAEERASQKTMLNHVALRWLAPDGYFDKQGNPVLMTNLMGGATDWFILPHSFGVAVAKSLIEKKATAHLSGLGEYFDEEGYSRLVQWLVELELLEDAMVY